MAFLEKCFLVFPSSWSMCSYLWNQVEATTNTCHNFVFFETKNEPFLHIKQLFWDFSINKTSSQSYQVNVRKYLIVQSKKLLSMYALRMIFPELSMSVAFFSSVNSQATSFSTFSFLLEQAKVLEAKKNWNKISICFILYTYNKQNHSLRNGFWF